MKPIKLISFLILLTSQLIDAQDRTKGIFIERKPGYYENSILRDDRNLEQQKLPPLPVKTFRADITGLSFPNKINLYKTIPFYNTPVSQGNTGTCWAFSTTSMYESEVFRITGKKVKLSEMYTVYWEYVEKAREFVLTRGLSAFAEGSEANAVTRIYKIYGIIPWEIYNGLTGGRKFHNHEAMFNEMQQFLASVKSNNLWNEQSVIETIRAILDHTMGKPPVTFNFSGKNITPMQYLNDELKLNMDDYVEIISYKLEPFWQKVEYKVPDNWWHSNDYYNVPLDVFMEALKNAIRNGYSFSIGGDVSEAGIDRSAQVAMVPTFDIPSAYIDDDARQFRFSNGSTTDDHGMHLVGYASQQGKDWFLIKDSGSGSRNNDENAPEFGFYFFSEDYLKLKIMDFTIHRDAVKEILSTFNH